MKPAPDLIRACVDRDPDNPPLIPEKMCKGGKCYECGRLIWISLIDSHIPASAEPYCVRCVNLLEEQEKGQRELVPPSAYFDGNHVGKA